jgi:hypothetical protein
MKITFSPLAESHFPLLRKWLETPHVKKWWDQDVMYTIDLLKEKYNSYIKGYKLVHARQKPIQGFIINHKWCASGKSIIRYLKSDNPALALEFTQAMVLML